MVPFEAVIAALTHGLFCAALFSAEGSVAVAGWRKVGPYGDLRLFDAAKKVASVLLAVAGIVNGRVWPAWR